MAEPSVNVWLERYFSFSSDDETADLEDYRHRFGWNRTRSLGRHRWSSRRYKGGGTTSAGPVRSGFQRFGPRFDGDSFCNCPLPINSDCNAFESVCKCGEDDTSKYFYDHIMPNYAGRDLVLWALFDWAWDRTLKTTATSLNADDREVKFHPEFSCGTAAIRGDKMMTKGQYYWEVKMTTPVYGTDMMIGVGTTKMDLFKYRFTFGSLLGSDCESWALSYTGNLHHEGITQKYTTKFGQGNIIGIHLDMWHGTLSFYKNRCPLGIAYHGLQGKVLYPMVSSTSARSGMKVVRSRSFESSLQFLCCMKLRRMIPKDKSVLDIVEMPPGLKTFLNNNLNWLLCYKVTERKSLESRQEHTSKRYLHEEDESCDEELECLPKFKRLCLPLVRYLH